MPTFEELLNALRNPVEGETAPSFDDLESAYKDELSVRDAAVKDRDGKLTAAEKAIADKDLEVMRFKSANYDLLMATPGKTDDTKPPETEEPSGIASLFAKG